MRDETRTKSNLWTMEQDGMDDALKGFLMDKGAAESERHMYIIQRKMTCVQEAMMRLVADQRTSAKVARCDCMDLYLATNKITDGTKRKMAPNAGALLLGDMKAACVLEWRAKQDFARKFSLNPTSRLHPFDTKHGTHQLIFDYVMQTSPSYYKIYAAYENTRLTLNFALKALRKIALDIHKLKAEAEHLPRGLFDKKTSRISGRLLTNIDPTGELTKILRGLYF